MAPGFLKGSSIDKADRLLIPCEDRLYGWLLSSTTTIHTKMNLSKPLPPPPAAHQNRKLTTRKPLPLAVSQPSVFLPQYRISTSSESSDPGITDDQHWSGSETTVEDRQSSETELWDSYFWVQDKDTLLKPFNQVDQRTLPSIQNQGSTLSSYNRNFASSNLSGLNIDECPAELHRSCATRTPRRAPKSLPQNTYSTFPAVPPKPRYDSAHKSWPLHDDSQTKLSRPVLRSRANTTPADCKALAASNLSTCSTLDDDYSPSHSTCSSASGLYMYSAPVSPDFGPLMNLMEKSYFEDDSDDEESALATLATRLHIQMSSANTPRSGSREKMLRSQKSRKNLKSAGDAFKGMFGKKKATNGV